MRWTLVALVIAVSARATRADDEASVTVGGYVEAYYSLNLRLPSNRITNLRGFDGRDRTFTLSNVALSARGKRGALESRVVLQVGATPSSYYLGEPAMPGAGAVATSDSELWKYVQQATLAYAGPGDLVLEGGLFPSPIGPEVIPIKDNWNWSRSNLFVGLPFYHAGARASHPLGGGWTATLHVYNGWNSVVDNNDSPSVAASAAFTRGTLSGQVLYFGGIERASDWRHLFDAYASIAISDSVSMQAHLDGGLEPNVLGTSGWFASALYGKVQLASTAYAALRADYFREWLAADAGMQAAPIFWPTSWVASVTATLAAQPVDGLSVRIELRHDHAEAPAYFGGDVSGDGVTTPYVPNRRAQESVTVGATAWF